MTQSGMESASGAGIGPPPLLPFGLVLRHDGRFLHEGAPILNRKLRAHFERSVAYLPEEGKFVVRLRHFRAEVEVEEAGFFVRQVDLPSGFVSLSDGSRERLDLESLSLSPIDGALLCRVKRALKPEGLLARFDHGAQAELLAAVDHAGPDPDAGLEIRIAGGRRAFPDLESGA